MLKELNKKPRRNAIIWAVILVALAVFMLYSTDFSIFTVLKGPEPITNYAVEDLEGKYVKAEVNLVWQPLWYTGDSEETATESGYMVATELITDVNDVFTADIICVSVSKSKIQTMEDMWQRGNLVYEGTGDANDLGQSITLTGVVRRIASDERSFYSEAESYYGPSSDWGLATHDLVLVDGMGPGGKDNAATYVFSGIALVLVLFAIFKLVKAFTGGYQKDVRAYCAATGDSQQAMEHLENFWATTPALPGGIHANEELVMFMEGDNARVMPPQNIVWVYGSTITHRRNGIPTGRTYQLILADNVGKRHTVSMNSEDDSKQAQQALFPLLTGAVFGYDAERERMFKKDRAAFAQVAVQQHMPAPVDPAPAQQPDIPQQ